MIRLTIVLCAFLYVAMIVGPEMSGPAPDGPVEVNAQSTFDPAALLPTADAGSAMVIPASLSVTPPAAEDTPIVILTEDGELIEISAVIRPNEVEDDVIQVARHDLVVEPAQIDTAPALETVYVTGSRVNLRSGPSTANAVVMSLGFGAEAELIEEMSNGWTHIRDLESGRAGYMAARFLSPTQP